MDRSAQIVKVSLRGITVNVMLVIFKAIVGIAANSISVILDAVNNLSDALSSIITIIGTKLAGKAPDKDHPYGHGRIEYITSLVIAVIVLLAGVSSLKESVEKIIDPAETNFTALTIIVISSAVVTKFFLGRYFIAQGKRLNSSSLTASGTDASFDAVISIATLVSAIVSITAGLNIEGWLGAAISVFILKAGLEILRGTLSDIIGVRADRDLSSNIKKKINAFDGVFGCYDLILHNYGPEQNLGSAHIEVADTMTARQIDALSRNIMAQIYNEFGVILTIGIYAVDTVSEDAAHIKESILKIIESRKNVIGMHGLFISEERDFVSFDIIFDFEEKQPKEITGEIKAALENEYPGKSFFINIDRDFSD